MTMRSEDDVQAERRRLQAKLAAGLRAQAQSPEGSAPWEEAIREIENLGKIGAALAWVLAEVDDIEVPHFSLPEQGSLPRLGPLDPFWQKQLRDLSC